MLVVEIKTNKLISPALDYAVAKCEGWEDDRYMRSPYIRKNVHGRVIGVQVPIHREYRWFNPSTDWAQGGPIIEREKVKVSPYHNQGGWWGEHAITKNVYDGRTPLIAAMRCYVASKLGDTVQIPRELVP